MTWLPIIATLIVAGIIHIAAVLSVPHVATHDAWARLSKLGDVNTIKILPVKEGEQQSLPLLSPDMRYAMCRYDVSKGPVRLGTPLLDDLRIIALYTPLGDNFYTITGSDLKRSRVEVVLSTQAETLLQLEVDAIEDSENIVIVQVPQPTGIAVIRAPLRGNAYAERTEFALQRASCGRRLSVETTTGALDR